MSSLWASMGQNCFICSPHKQNKQTNKEQQQNKKVNKKHQNAKQQQQQKQTKILETVACFAGGGVGRWGWGGGMVRCTVRQ